MSFSITFTGAKDRVHEKIAGAVGYGDTTQFEAARRFILTEIEAMPDAVDGVQVAASGHHDAASRYVTIAIMPINLA